MIRLARESDVAEMLEIYAPYIVTTTHTFEYEVPAYAVFLQRFQRITEQFPWLVWEEAGVILGYAYASAPFERAAYGWVAEDSVYLRPEAEGRGIGKKLCLVLEKLLAYQGYRKIYAIITSENAHSLAFHERLGYRRVGEFPECGFKFGRWLGVIWMDKEIKNLDFPEYFPLKWKEIVQNEQKNSEILELLSLF